MSPILRMARAGLTEAASARTITRHLTIRWRFINFSLTVSTLCFYEIPCVRRGMLVGFRLCRPITGPAAKKTECQKEKRDQSHDKKNSDSPKDIPIQPVHRSPFQR